MAEMTEIEKNYLDICISHSTRKIQRFLGDHTVPYKDRLVLYLATPHMCFVTHPTVPEFHDFNVEHGAISWGVDFPFLRRDQAVNLVSFCRAAVNGNYTYYPESWTTKMICAFVKNCVDEGIHEFDYYW